LCINNEDRCNYPEICFIMDEQLLIDGCKRGEALARKELYELYAPAMMSVCVPVNLVINLWDNPDWNVYVSGGAA